VYNLPSCPASAQRFMDTKPALNQNILVRPASKEDARFIVEIHHDAVHKIANKDYEATALEDWSPAITDERVRNIEQQITAEPPVATMLVAEVNGAVVGFGEVIAANKELRSLYVSPTAVRTGVGKRLMLGLEDIARAQGATELWVDSSMNAEMFYVNCGYVSEGIAVHALHTGRKIACVKMRKKL
jgi:putative acetyltransferase